MLKVNGSNFWEERHYMMECPGCSEVVELKTDEEPIDGETYTCPNCGTIVLIDLDPDEEFDEDEEDY